MDGRSTREVQGAVAVLPTAVNPVGDRAVDENQPDGHEQDPRRELEPIGHRARDERRGDRGEGHEEGHEHQALCVAGHPLQADEVEVADPVTTEEAITVG